MIPSDVRADIARLQLSDSHRRFCCYLVAFGGNADLACRHANISSSVASNIQQNPVASDYIEYLVERRADLIIEEDTILKAAPVSREEVLQGLGEVFRGEKKLTEDVERAARLLISGKLLNPAAKVALVSIRDVVSQADEEAAV